MLSNFSVLLRDFCALLIITAVQDSTAAVPGISLAFGAVKNSAHVQMLELSVACTIFRRVSK